MQSALFAAGLQRLPHFTVDRGGMGHWFTKIDDHIDYFIVRIDPDKITPLKSEAQSQDYLSKPADGGQWSSSS